VATDLRTSAVETSQPLSVTERAVAALWSEVLQTAELPGTTDNFFALVGDSMAMVMLEFRIKEEFSVELPAGALLGAPTLRELSALVYAACGGSRSLGTQSAETSPK
jgi:acyl carrier protein